MTWTKQDCDRLIALKQQTEPKLTSDEIGGMLGRSRKAINVKYNKLRYGVIEEPRKPRPRPDRKTQTAYERNGERWTAEESAELIRRIEAGELYPAAGHALNRTAWACKVQYGILKRGGGAKLSQAELSRRANIEAQEEAIRQAKNAPPPASITAWLMGDPPLSRSALGKKMGVSR